MIGIQCDALVADRQWFDAALTASHLKNDGYDVTVCYDGQEAYERLLDPTPPSVAVVGTDLPRLSGSQIARRTRAQGLDLAILLVHPAPGNNGLQPAPSGAISKPLRSEKLLAMVEEVRRAHRHEPTKARRIRLGARLIDFRTRTATGGDVAPIRLSAQESGLLQYLAHRHGRTVPLEEIKANLEIPESITRFLFELRWKLGNSGLSPHLRPVGRTACRLVDFEVLA